MTGNGYLTLPLNGAPQTVEAGNLRDQQAMRVEPTPARLQESSRPGRVLKQTPEGDDIDGRIIGVSQEVLVAEVDAEGLLCESPRRSADLVALGAQAGPSTSGHEMPAARAHVQHAPRLATVL